MFTSEFIEDRNFINIKLNGRKLRCLLDSDAIQSYIGRNQIQYFKDIYTRYASKVTVADGKEIDIQGVMNVTIVIDNIVKTIPFGLVDKLDYECILGIDFMESFKMKMDYGDHTWRSPTGPLHSFQKCVL